MLIDKDSGHDGSMGLPRWGRDFIKLLLGLDPLFDRNSDATCGCEERDHTYSVGTVNVCAFNKLNIIDGRYDIYIN